MAMPASPEAIRFVRLSSGTFAPQMDKVPMVPRRIAVERQYGLDAERRTIEFAVTSRARVDGFAYSLSSGVGWPLRVPGRFFRGGQLRLIGVLRIMRPAV